MQEGEELVEGLLGVGFVGEAVERVEGVEVGGGAEADGDGVVAGEERVVARAVDEGLLGAREVGGEEDVAAPGFEQGVEGGGGGGGEGWERAWRGG